MRIAPAFNALSNKYPQATFLEVDVHQCQVGAPKPPPVWGKGLPMGSAGKRAGSGELEGERFRQDALSVVWLRLVPSQRARIPNSPKLGEQNPGLKKYS